jgi:mRNA interferase MazF
MATFDRFAVVKVPFPFADRLATKTRPALILSDAVAFNVPAGHSVLAMITSAKHSSWPLDVPLTDLATAGLPAPSIVRMKLFTLDHRLILARLGTLCPVDRQSVSTAIAQLFASPAE